jgi:aerobic-type carbon monoxide dehydrogenase small subunit (CoxS/CutS family)
MELLINGKKYSVEPADDESLLSVLRNSLDLTGSKYGCGEGACGACTVLIDNKAERSCITQAKNAAGKNVVTIEGLAKGEVLHPVQKAFLETDVFQCAYCAPGMIMSAVSLLQKKSSPTDEEIIKSMQANICRCGTYPRIIQAIRQASNV